MDKAFVACGLRAASTFLSGAYFGGCSYVTYCECPARINLPNGNSMIDNFQQTFPRAKAYQGIIAILGALGSVAQYFLDTDHPKAKMVLAAGMVLLTLWPYTIVCIMPTNYQLMDGDVPKKKGDSWVTDMMNKWDRLHFVRTFVGGISFLMYVYALSQ